MRTVLLVLCVYVWQAGGWSIFGGGDAGDKAAEGDDVEEDAGSDAIVGARIETCRGCRLNYLPRVRNFISHIAPQFKAVTVKYIQGAPPDILYLNEFGKEVARDHMDDYSEKGLEELLKKRKITRKTPAPTFRAQNFKPTEHCLAFRGTDMCDPTEERLFSGDASCKSLVGAQQAGNCECKTGVSFPVQCGERDDLPMSCEELCADMLEGSFLMSSD